MAKITEEQFRYYYCLLAWLFMLFGMVFSKVMLSMGVIGLALNAVFHRELAGHWRRFVGQPALLALTGVFVLYALSGLWSENTDWLANRLRMKLPFLLLPFSVAALPQFGQREYRSLLYFFFLLLLAVCLYLLGWYLFHYEQVTHSYQTGQVIPTPCRHIHFSLMTAFAALIGWDLWRRRFYWRYPGVERAVQAAGGLFLVVFLHILAVRSGMVAFYLAAVYLLAWYAVAARRWAIAIAVGGALAIGAWLAVRYVPTLQNKINYTLYNIHQIRRGENLRDLSDAYRVATIQAGVQMVREHPWTGVGIGDIRDATSAYMHRHYPELADTHYMPQSQAVLAAAALGWPGLLLFGGCILLPFFYGGAFRDPLLAGFGLVALSAFLVEQLLETQTGSAFFLVFLLGFIRERIEADLRTD